MQTEPGLGARIVNTCTFACLFVYFLSTRHLLSQNTTTTHTCTLVQALNPRETCLAGITVSMVPWVVTVKQEVKWRRSPVFFAGGGGHDGKCMQGQEHCTVQIKHPSQVLKESIKNRANFTATVGLCRILMLIWQIKKELHLQYYGTDWYFLKNNEFHIMFFFSFTIVSIRCENVKCECLKF